jgi:ankyrin repeat protein
VVVNDALDFLRARGHDTDKLTDYEIEETFTAAFKNWQYIDNLHQAIEGNSQRAVAEELLSNFLAQGVPVAN